MQSQNTRPKVGDIIETDAESRRVVGEVTRTGSSSTATLYDGEMLVRAFIGEDIEPDTYRIVHRDQVARVWREVTR